MIALGSFRTSLATFNATELFDAAMIGFDHPGDFGVLEATQLGHRQVVGGPVFNVSVCSDNLEDFDQAIRFEMNQRPFGGDIDLVERPIARPVWIDVSIGCQTG